MNTNYLNEKNYKLIKKLKKKINFYNTNLFTPDYDFPIYFPSYSNGQGLFFLKKKIGLKNNFFILFFFILKDFFYCTNYFNIKLAGNKKIESKKIISTWVYKKNFKKNGSIQEDRNYNINSRQTTDIHWVVLYLDNELPKKIDNNITLIQIKKKKTNIFFLLKELVFNFKYIFRDFNYFLFSITSHNFLSKKILEIFKKLINTKSIKKFLITYESQPYQNRIIEYLNRNKVRTFGYISQAPLALPSHLIKKKTTPFKIFVNGVDQKKCLMKLGWKKNKIIVIPSTRFLNSKKNFSNQIFLPGAIKSFDIIINSLEFLIVNYGLNINQYKVRDHPAEINSRIHKKLKYKINLLKKKYSTYPKRKSLLKNHSIFIGASGAIVEALERKCKVIQIAEIPAIECYSSFFWENIKLKIINGNIFTYSLKKRKKLVLFGKKPKNLNIFFDK